MDERKVAAARVWAAARMPYLASALFAAVVRPAPDSRTIAVDRGWAVRADPAVVDELDAGQLGRLLVHLVSHLLRDHAGRAERRGVGEAGRGGRWNRAADAEVNDDLAWPDCVPAVAPTMPAELGCAPNELAERYYEAGFDGPRAWDCGSGADGCPRPWDGDGGLDGHQCELLRLATAAELRRQAGREPGTVPAGWLRWAEAVLPSRVDWRRVLAAEVRRAVAVVAGNADYGHRRPSRRAHLDPRIVLPAMHRPVPEVAVVVDTSGSMDDRLLARAVAEVEGVLARAGLRGRAVRVLAVDTAVHTVTRVSRAAQVTLAGGGGTDMGAGLGAAAQLRPRPQVVIVLTDGYTPWPDRPPPGVRVVVGLLADARFGEAPPPAPDWARSVVIEE